MVPSHHPYRPLLDPNGRSHSDHRPVMYLEVRNSKAGLFLRLHINLRSHCSLLNYFFHSVLLFRIFMVLQCCSKTAMRLHPPKYSLQNSKKLLQLQEPKGIWSNEQHYNICCMFDQSSRTHNIFEPLDFVRFQLLHLQNVLLLTHFWAVVIRRLTRLRSHPHQYRHKHFFQHLNLCNCKYSTYHVW